MVTNWDSSHLVFMIGSSWSSSFPSVCDIHYPPYGPYSITITFKSSIEWSGREKCLATGFFFGVWCLIDGLSDERGVHSPFLWRVEWHVVCTQSSTPRSMVAFVQNHVPVVVLLNTVPTLIRAHALQCGWLPSLCCLNTTLTRRSLRLGGRQYATGGTLEVLLSKGDISMTQWWSRRLCVKWGRSGWKWPLAE